MAEKKKAVKEKKGTTRSVISRARTQKAKSSDRVFFSSDDAYYFGQGVHYDIYRKLGAHPSMEDGNKGYYFAVWAPHAKYVAVTGEFNGWDTGANPLSCDNEVGVWSVFVPGVEEGAMYKY